MISDSGKYLALSAEEDYYVFSTVAGADKTCADYSNAYIKFTLPKDAIIKVTGGVEGSTTIEEFAKTNYKNRSGAYAEYTLIIKNNSIIGFSCLAD